MALIAIVAALVPAAAQAIPNVTYNQTNLVSDIPGLAQQTDPNLKNPWGLAAGPTSALWVSDNATDVATLYPGATTTKPISISSLVVGIPGGAPTGQVFNPTSGFVVTDGTNSGPAAFLFSSESGNITGWNPTVPPPPPSKMAQPAVHTPGAIYKGLTMAQTRDGNSYIYATDFHNGRIDAFDSKFAPAKLPGHFKDPFVPKGFAPFGIQAINNKLVVTYAKQDADAEDDVAGRGLGIVDVFSASGCLLHRFHTGGVLNAPWGIALAPKDFGIFSNKLLIGNFGDGVINAFDPRTGIFVGSLRDGHGKVIRNEGLWGLRFGNGTTGNANTLLFSDGLNDEENGLLGSIEVDTL
ncbi:MAG: TIGR03118 family protein [Solirubrobacterales bacterium]